MSNIKRIYDTGDNKTFGLVYENNIGSTSIQKITNWEDEITKKRTNEVQNLIDIKSTDGKVNYHFRWTTDMLINLSKMINLYFDEKIVNKAIRIVPHNGEDDKLELTGNIDITELSNFSNITRKAQQKKDEIHLDKISKILIEMGQSQVNLQSESSVKYFAKRISNAINEGE